MAQELQARQREAEDGRCQVQPLIPEPGAAPLTEADRDTEVAAFVNRAAPAFTEVKPVVRAGQLGSSTQNFRRTPLAEAAGFDDSRR